MRSLVLNFLKRAIAIPLVVLILAVGVITVAVPKLHLSVSKATEVQQQLDLSAYRLTSYKTFSSLQEEEFVGSLKSKDFAFGEIAVLNSSQSGSSAGMLSVSKEPWNGGGVVVVGRNTFNQLRSLHKAVKGDTVDFSFYDNDTYTYKITKIIPGVSENKLNTYYADGTLAMCVPYNDFSDLGESYFYTVYLAKQV